MKLSEELEVPLRTATGCWWRRVRAGLPRARGARPRLVRRRSTRSWPGTSRTPRWSWTPAGTWWRPTRRPPCSWTACPGAAAEPVNVMRLSLHPEAMGGRLVNLAEVRAHLLHRLRRQAEMSGYGRLAELHDELAAYVYPGVDLNVAHVPGPADILLPLRIRHGDRDPVDVHHDRHVRHACGRDGLRAGHRDVLAQRRGDRRRLPAGLLTPYRSPCTMSRWMRDSGTPSTAAAGPSR